MRDGGLPLEEAISRANRIAATLQRFEEHRAWIDQQIARAGRALGNLLEIGVDRMLRLRTAFSSTGLDVGAPDVVMRELAAVQDPRIHSGFSVIASVIGYMVC